MKSFFILTSWEVVKKWNDPHVLVCGFSKLIEPLEIKRTQAYYPTPKNWISSYPILRCSSCFMASTMGTFM